MHRLILPLLLLTLVYLAELQKSIGPLAQCNKKELILNGALHQDNSDGGTGEILVYAEQGDQPATATSRAYSFWSYTYHMYVDSTGKRYHWLRKRPGYHPHKAKTIIYRR
jgi:hypothetical protein